MYAYMRVCVQDCAADPNAKAWLMRRGGQGNLLPLQPRLELRRHNLRPHSSRCLLCQATPLSHSRIPTVIARGELKTFARLLSGNAQGSAEIRPEHLLFFC